MTLTKLLTTTLAGLALAGSALGSAGLAQTPAATTAPAAKLSSDSTVRDLLADPAARAILTKNVPAIIEHAPEYPEVYAMSLKTLATIPEAQTMGGLTADVLKKIEAELATL